MQDPEEEVECKDKTCYITGIGQCLCDGQICKVVFNFVKNIKEYLRVKNG
jgi:hypothetical protein